MKNMSVKFKYASYIYFSSRKHVCLKKKKGKLDGKMSYRWRGMPVERVQIVENMSLRRKIGKLDGKCELQVKKCSR